MVHFMCQLDWAMGSHLISEDLTRTKRLNLPPVRGKFLLPDHPDLGCCFFPSLGIKLTLALPESQACWLLDWNCTNSSSVLWLLDSDRK